MRLSGSLAVLVSLTLFVACGSDNGGGTGGLPGGAGTTGPVSVEDFPKRYVDTFCKVVSSCCTASGVAYDDGYCHRSNEFDPGKYAGLTAGTVTRFDPDGAGRCLDAVVAAGCGVKDDIDQPGCEGTFVGVVPQGGECYDDIACAPILGKRVGCGGIKYEDGPGACAEFIVSEAGGPCGRDVYGECAKGLVCEDYKVPTSVCISAPRLGEKCSLGGPCEDGASCSGSTFVCEPRVANGGACKSFTECPDDSRCGFPSGVCEPRGADGVACGTGEDCLSYRCVSGRCRQKVIQSCGGDDGDTAPGPPIGAGN